MIASAAAAVDRQEDPLIPPNSCQFRGDLGVSKDTFQGCLRVLAVNLSSYSPLLATVIVVSQDTT